MSDSTPCCAGCGEPVPEFGRKRFFFNSPGEQVHDNDACVQLRNERLAAREFQREAAPEMFEALRECEEYFDQRADAEYFIDSPTPVGNAEMKMLVLVREALAKATGEVVR
jgi:hypothetical protein